MADVHYSLWIFCLVVVLLGLGGVALILGGFKRLFHGHFAAAGSRLLFGLLLFFVFAFVAAVALDLRTYLRLSGEKPVATLSFAALGPQQFHATLTETDGRVRSIDLRGDDWELDARILKWKGWATVLGMDPVYRLERLEGRYRNAGQESHDYHSVLELANDPGLDFWALVQRQSSWMPWADATYGTGTYLPMADGAQYQVSVTPTGLLARPINKAANDAMAHW
jgi:hypothetical protein